VRDYRTPLRAVLKRKPATVNNALAAVDDFYNRRGLGPADAVRKEPAAAHQRPFVTLGRRHLTARTPALAIATTPPSQAGEAQR